MFRFISPSNRFFSRFLNSSPSQHSQQLSPIGIDFNHAINMIQSNYKNFESGETPLPDSIIKIQQHIFNCNENQIIKDERVLAARFLYQIEIKKHVHPAKCNVKLIEKMWDLLNIDRQSTSSSDYIDILSDKLGIAIKTWYFYPKCFNSVKELVNEISILESSGKFSMSDQRLQEVLKNAYHVAYVIGMWKEMIWIRERLSKDSIAKSMTFYQNSSQFGVDEAYKIITNQIENSIFKSPIVDIHKESEPIDHSDIYPYKIFQTRTIKYRNPSITNVDMDPSDFKTRQNTFDKLKTPYLKMSDNQGWLKKEKEQLGDNENFLIIVGKAVKLVIDGGIYSGVYDKNSNRLQLYNFNPQGVYGYFYETHLDATIQFTQLSDGAEGVIIKGHQRSSHTQKPQGTSYNDLEMDLTFEAKDMTKVIID